MRISKVDFLAIENELEEKVDIPWQQITRPSDLAKCADLRHLSFSDFKTSWKVFVSDRTSNEQ